MATITGLTAERMLEIEAASVVDGDVVGNDLILARKDGSIINAGNVRGPAGPTGPMGSALAVVTARDLLDVGQPNQIRAGRQLTPADFTNMGLSAPLGLWNLSNANDSSGNARHLTIKGAVPFDTGINGLASTAAKFSGSTAQALYIADTGAADPFRIKTGSWGCWFRTAKRGATQYLMAKVTNPYVQANSWFDLVVGAGNAAQSGLYSAAFAVTLPGTADVADDRWHHATVTWDGTTGRLYVDGALDGQVKPAVNGPLGGGAAPLNIGGYGADAGTAAVSPFYGRVDEAFVTADVLSEDQIRNLYCASVPHALGSSPNVIRLGVRRKRRGAALATTDFPAQPLRLYNFTAGAVTDQGSNGTSLVNAGNAPVSVAGADGSKDGGFYVGSVALQHFASSDAGLPAGLTTRSFGCWVKTLSNAGSSSSGILSWGTISTGDTKLVMGQASAASPGAVISANGADVIIGPRIDDGLWHHLVVVEDNTASDLVKRKLYLDGRLVVGSTVLNPITLAGAGHFRIGAQADGTIALTNAEVDGVFVHNIALTPEQVRAIYDKGSQVLAPSPKSDADHIEAIEAGRLLATFDTLETCDAIDLAVMA